MSTTDCATETSLPPSPTEDFQIDALEGAYEGTSKLLRGLFFGFAGTVTIGLALASWYLCVRIVAADQAAPASAPTAGSANSAPAPPLSTASSATTGGPANSTAASPLSASSAVSPQTVAEDSMAQAFWYTVPPVTLYLQAAGLGPKQDADFVRSLQSRGFRAQIQNRDAGNARILIGPYSSHTELEQGQRKLQSEGVLAVETAY